MCEDEVPAVGTYEIDHHTISKKITKEEEDPDLAVKRPGFLSGGERFMREQATKKEPENQYLNPHQAHENIEEILMKRKQAQQNHPNLSKVLGR